MTTTAAPVPSHKRSVPGVCLLLVCGAPAAGKSTLAAHVAERFQGDTWDVDGHPGIEVVVRTLQLDAIMEEVQRQPLRGNGRDANGPHPQDNGNEPPTFLNEHNGTPFDADLWHEASGLMLQRCEEELRSSLDDAIARRRNGNDGMMHVVMVDDNLHLPSMRHRYKTLFLRAVHDAISLPHAVPEAGDGSAQRSVVAELFEVLVVAPIDVLLRRNGQREGHRRIPESVVVKLHNCFAADAPNWPTCTSPPTPHACNGGGSATSKGPCSHALMAHRRLIVNDGNNGCPGDGCGAMRDGLAASICTWMVDVLQHHAVAATPHPAEGSRWHYAFRNLQLTTEETTANERAVSSFGHRLDQSLRRIVATVMQAHSPSRHGALLAKRCTNAKKQIMALARSKDWDLFRTVGASCATEEELDRCVFDVFARVAQLSSIASDGDGCSMGEAGEER